MNRIILFSLFVLSFFPSFLNAQEEEILQIIRIKFDTRYEEALLNKKFPKIFNELEEIELKNKIKKFPENYTEIINIRDYSRDSKWFFSWENKEYQIEKLENHLIIYEIFYGNDESIPIEELPLHILQESGKITFFADYNNIKNDIIIIYLINLTGEHFILPSKGFIYVEAEALENGVWERVQPHCFSWCGFGIAPYYRVKSNSFARFRKIYPTGNETRSIRYRAYHKQDNLEIVSNVGEGKISLEEMENARYDSMTVAFTNDFNLLKNIIEGNIVPNFREKHITPIGYALRNLPRLKNKKQSKIYLKKLLELREFQNSNYSIDARMALNELLHFENRQKDSNFNSESEALFEEKIVLNWKNSKTSAKSEEAILPKEAIIERFPPEKFSLEKIVRAIKIRCANGVPLSRDQKDFLFQYPQWRKAMQKKNQIKEPIEYSENQRIKSKELLKKYPENIYNLKTMVEKLTANALQEIPLDAKDEEWLLQLDQWLEAKFILDATKNK